VHIGLLPVILLVFTGIVASQTISSRQNLLWTDHMLSIITKTMAWQCWFTLHAQSPWKPVNNLV